MSGISPVTLSAAESSSSSGVLRLVVADDSFLVREGLVQLLALSARVRVVASVADPAALLTAIDAHEPDVVLTDIRMPPTHTDEGVQVAEALQRSHPGLGVVVLSLHASTQYAARLLASGSAGRGYLLKDRIHDLEHLLATIEAVARGECSVDPVMVDGLLGARRRQGGGPLEQLTPRQCEIMAAIAAGRSNLAIAQQFGLSQRAVEKHVSEIFGRLGIANDEAISRRVQATLIFLGEAD